MQKLKKLPIGIQSFEIIREQGYLYIDKTANIFRLVDDGMFYFLSRPRRFGKSLLVSTLKCLFQGRRELFGGLWVVQHTDWEWKSHPVILIDFNSISHDTPENLKLGLGRTLLNIAQSYEIELEEPLLTEQFKQLIVALFQKTGMPVVILVDEYDKPIIDHLGKGATTLEVAKANRDILKRFWGTLKGGDIAPLLRFVLLTGISKFSKVSIFSELNNLNDISLHERYATMLGYTYEELNEYFADYLEAFSQKQKCSEDDLQNQLSLQYNGYRFSKQKTKVYNPFSILKSLDELDLGNYWFETGTPTFLVNLLKEQHYPLPQIEKLQLEEESFRTYDIEQLRPEAILFQAGYVTIQNYKAGLFTLGYPNQEVKLSFLKHLFFAVSEMIPGATSSQLLWLTQYLHQEDWGAFFDTITALFASIPYTLNSKRDEAYFHTLFYLMVTSSGGTSRNEVLTSRGRLDLEVEFPDKVFLIEFKCNQSAETAIQQIQEKGYPEKFKTSSKKVILLGINFDSESKNLEDWKVG